MKSVFPLKNIRAVFSDLDDTITERTGIHPETYQSICRLKEKGFRVVIVSGRPAGWADCLMRLWPVDAMIFENGAGIMTRDGERIKTRHLADDQTLVAQRKILQSIFDNLKNRYPQLKLATDQSYRLCDFAIDVLEEPPFFSEFEINGIVEEIAKHKNITVKLSSIHINYWYGSHTKVTACENLLTREGKNWGITEEQVIFSGDSPNDEPLFEYFPYTVGVANVRKYLDRMKFPPKHITQLPSGQGFREFTGELLSAGGLR